MSSIWPYLYLKQQQLRRHFNDVAISWFELSTVTLELENFFFSILEKAIGC